MNWCYFLFVLNLTPLINAKLVGTTLEKKIGVPEMNTCRLVVSNLKFNYKNLGIGDYAKFWDAACGYPPAIGTFLLCTYDLKNNDTSFLEHTIYKSFTERCNSFSSYNYTEIFYKEQFENATKNFIPINKVNTSLPLYKATLPNMKKYASSYKMYNAMSFNEDSGTWFSVGILGYFLLLILLSAIFNFIRYLGLTKIIYKSKFLKICQKYLIYPTLIPKGRFNQSYGFKYFSILFPNRIQFLVDLFLCALEIAFYSVDYRYVSKSAWPTYIGYRSGILAFGKLPLLILFAGRNNFLLYITGWSYSTFLHFHKVIAYWMSIDTLIHSVAFTIAYLGKYVLSLHSRYFACGVAATVICGVIVLQSFHIFRNLFYEYFLAFHIVLVICFIAMCWYHCIDLGWMEWLVASCCVWFFDRTIRTIRIMLFGFKTATITAVGDKLMRVEVEKPSWWCHSPGTYGYIYFLNIIFWENNPFTIVNENDKLLCFIKIKKGVTARMWRQLQENNGIMKKKICIEGPYGGNLFPIFKKFDDSILIAGGSGVPGILEAAINIRQGKMIWIAQHQNFIYAYKSLIEKVNIPIDIYITRENNENFKCSYRELTSSSSDDTDKESIKEKTNYKEDQISVIFEKPDLNTIISTSITESQFNNLAVVACGPPIVMDNIMNLVAKEVVKSDKNIEFFNELQVW